LDRRNFLKKAAAFCTRIGLALAVGYPAFAFVLHSGRRTVQVIFSHQERRGRVSFKDNVFLLQEEQSVRAVSARCTHLGCTVQHDPVSNRFVCPCHGSAFDAEGRRIKGPAEKDLETLPVALSKGGDLTVSYVL